MDDVMKLERIGEWVRWDERKWVNLRYGGCLIINGPEELGTRPTSKGAYTLNFYPSPDYGQSKKFDTESEAVAFAREIMGGEK